ncbi:uncharacterized protein LOC128224420 [Mya arenaria]|uniref:uncharacterized protein LOC128224420 n=1 Tax=Mya arenaria TaxID=6604 RepID=UPI0022E77349|nr:uncharacterized protein LOC128224420 [Mya arenaria]
MKVSNCQICGSKDIQMQESFNGSAAIIEWVCQEGHRITRWYSQPTLNRGVLSGDFLISATTVLSGNNFGKMKLWADMLQLKFPSASKFFRIQWTYLVPSVDRYWETHLQDLFQSLRGKDVVILGDGRNDSPGHSAQYCSYSVMDNETKKVIMLKTVDKRETARKSVAMEKVALKACLEDLLQNQVNITKLVTDGHLGIAAMMRTDYSTLPKIKHSHDIWHVAKNLGKNYLR